MSSPFYRNIQKNYKENTKMNDKASFENILQQAIITHLKQNPGWLKISDIKMDVHLTCLTDAINMADYEKTFDAVIETMTTNLQLSRRRVGDDLLIHLVSEIPSRNEVMCNCIAKWLSDKTDYTNISVVLEGVRLRFNHANQESISFNGLFHSVLNSMTESGQVLKRTVSGILYVMLEAVPVRTDDITEVSVRNAITGFLQVESNSTREAIVAAVTNRLNMDHLSGCNTVNNVINEMIRNHLLGVKQTTGGELIYSCTERMSTGAEIDEVIVKFLTDTDQRWTAKEIANAICSRLGPLDQNEKHAVSIVDRLKVLADKSVVRATHTPTDIKYSIVSRSYPVAPGPTVIKIDLPKDGGRFRIQVGDTILDIGTNS